MLCLTCCFLFSTLISFHLILFDIVAAPFFDDVWCRTIKSHKQFVIHDGAVFEGSHKPTHVHSDFIFLKGSELKCQKKRALGDFGQSLTRSTNLRVFEDTGGMLRLHVGRGKGVLDSMFSFDSLHPFIF